jgi:hypothetical protein
MPNQRKDKVFLSDRIEELCKNIKKQERDVNDMRDELRMHKHDLLLIKKKEKEKSCPWNLHKKELQKCMNARDVLVYALCSGFNEQDMILSEGRIAYITGYTRNSVKHFAKNGARLITKIGSKNE